MLLERWSTETLPPHEQFSAVRAKLLDSPAPVRIERRGVPSDAPFSNTVAVHGFPGEVMAVHARGHSADGFRDAPELARGAPEMAWLIQYARASGVAILDGEPYPVQPGDIVYGDCGVTMTGMTGDDDIDYMMWMMPRAALRPLLDDPAGDPRGVLHRSEPLGEIAAGYLANLGRTLDRIDGDQPSRLLPHLATLLAMQRGLGSYQDEPARAVLDDVRLVAIRRDIRRRFRDPALSPATVARHHAMSVRTLHALFEPSGTTFGRFLLDVRLAAATTLIMDRTARRRSVADIAFACGFESLATFYRAFRARHGCSPRDMAER